MTSEAPQPEWREVARRILGKPDPEPEKTGNVVQAEGRDPGKTSISPDQYSRDFLRRINGEIPAHAEVLPEPE
jgi:hypothetical protein